jgi:small redox-active disulfide protein 2
MSPLKGETMEIKVLGSGCAKCGKLEDIAHQAVKELGLDAEVLHVTELAEIMAYGVMSTPALVVDEKVRFAGRVPSLAEIKSALQS